MTRPPVAALCVLVLSAAAAGPLAATEPAAPPAPRGYLGVSVAATSVPALPEGEAGSFPSALEVVFLAPGAAGERSGVRTGDIVLELDGRVFDPKDGDPVLQYRSALQDRRPGDVVRLLLLRRAVDATVLVDGEAVAEPAAILATVGASLAAMPDGGRLEISARRQPRLLRLEVALGVHPMDAAPMRPLPRLEDVHPGMDGEAAPFPGPFVERWTARLDLVAPVADLRARFARLAASDDGWRQDDVRLVFAAPELLPLLGERARAELAPRGVATDVEGCLRALARRAGASLPSTLRPLRAGLSAEGHAEALEQVLAETVALRGAALADLTPFERDFVASRTEALAAALAEGIYLHADENEARRQDDLRLVEISRRVDRGALHRAALSWARLADPEWLAGLARDLARDARAGQAVILRRETRHGAIVLAGNGRNVHRDDEPAILVDLGGDDVYGSSSGSSSWEARPACAVIDLAGDDVHDATSAFAQGTGAGGVGLLVDVSGDDRYTGGDFAQGAGVMGVGVLLDLAGDDTYRARRIAQGAGLWGAGLLLDAAGRDVHEALGLAQGLGLPGGFGVLHDASGDDLYFAKGGSPTGYGTRGVFDGFAQGCGLGFRLLQSGGLGLLADDDGRDAYEAGNFSQGGGYFFGWGLLADAGTDDDRYLASRYGQGFAAHQALGSFLDEGGNDSYRTTHGVIAGLAWDQCVTSFEDRSGDDLYEGDFFSLGATAHDATCFFLDRSGSDTYSGTPVGRSGPNDYHGGTSLSVFLDAGPGRDRYGAEGPAAGTVERRGEHSIVADLPRIDADPARGATAPAAPGR